ncbi:hypothetical protein M422DRAFT_29580 [Sphaerobolus stellatus SS14]|uniref:Unplaced genomic scaffold SPHSTscaffold_35, whole genome shotgun sequence n=1 Tax=Sphaerobolus stellatus (strain SS14) TaxID=990650 RepID=A0A0C9VG43_SPHS4|nr:hypothetical protein M422DRAFT_29580 [Sphaerobolus stellatus SS14]
MSPRDKILSFDLNFLRLRLGYLAIPERAPHSRAEEHDHTMRGLMKSLQHEIQGIPRKSGPIELSFGRLSEKDIPNIDPIHGDSLFLEPRRDETFDFLWTVHSLIHRVLCNAELQRFPGSPPPIVMPIVSPPKGRAQSSPSTGVSRHISKREFDSTIPLVQRSSREYYFSSKEAFSLKKFVRLPEYRRFQRYTFKGSGAEPQSPYDLNLGILEAKSVQLVHGDHPDEWTVKNEITF